MRSRNLIAVVLGLLAACENTARNVPCVDCGTLYVPDASSDGNTPGDAIADAVTDASDGASLDAASDADVPSSDVPSEFAAFARLTPNDALNPPRLIAPLSSSLSSTQSPTLRWRDPPGESGAVALVCRDRGCASIERVVFAKGDTAAVTDPLTPGVHFWTVFRHRGEERSARPSAVWEINVGRRSAGISTAMNHYADYDGDGFSDLAVPGSTVGGAATEVLVYRGNADGLSPRPAQRLTGPAGSTDALSWFANTTRLDAGDLNGDGYSDLAVRTTVAERPQVFVYYGGSSGLQTTPTVALTRQVPPESLGVGRTNPSALGVAMTPVGDINGDGYGDLALTELGRAEGPRDAGFIHLYFGSASGVTPAPSRVLGPEISAAGRVTSDSEQGVGFSLAAGDLNGDGFGDLVASTSSPLGQLGNLRVFLGSADGPTYAMQTRLENPDSTGRSGRMAASVGVADVNGDGYGDVLTGLGAGASNAYLTFAGSASGPSSTPAQRALATVPDGPAPRVATAGDLDGDGYVDTVVLSSQTELTVLRGGASGLTTGAAIAPTGATFEQLLIVTIAHDFNSDGFADAHYGARVRLGSATGLGSTETTLTP